MLCDWGTFLGTFENFVYQRVIECCYFALSVIKAVKLYTLPILRAFNIVLKIIALSALKISNYY